MGPTGARVYTRGRGSGMCRRRGQGRGQGKRLQRRCRATRDDQPARPVALRPLTPRTMPEAIGRAESGAAPVGHTHRVVKTRDARLGRVTVTPVAYVDEQRCTLCGACQAMCPTEAIALGQDAVRVNADLCCGCGACVEVCPNEAIRLN